MDKLHEQIKETDDYISKEEFKEGFKHWKETTSTLPSGRHLGHYRALLAYEEAPDDEESPTISKRYWEALTAMINICIKHSVILPRWSIVVNAMIEKIPGTPRLDKLRVIHLFEADLNLVFGILFSIRMMKQCEGEKFKSRTMGRPYGEERK